MMNYTSSPMRAGGGMLGFQIKPESFEVFLRKLEKNKKTPDDFFDKNGYNIEYIVRAFRGRFEIWGGTGNIQLLQSEDGTISYDGLKCLRCGYVSKMPEPITAKDLKPMKLFKEPNVSKICEKMFAGFHHSCDFERVKAGKIERENNKISAEKDLFLNWLEFISQKEKRLGVE